MILATKVVGVVLVVAAIVVGLAAARREMVQDPRARGLVQATQALVVAAGLAMVAVVAEVVTHS